MACETFSRDSARALYHSSRWQNTGNDKCFSSLGFFSIKAKLYVVVIPNRSLGIRVETITR